MTLSPDMATFRANLVKIHQHAFFARSGRPAYRVYSLVDLPARISRAGKLLQAAGLARLVASGELIPNLIMNPSDDTMTIQPCL